MWSQSPEKNGSRLVTPEAPPPPLKGSRDTLLDGGVEKGSENHSGGSGGRWSHAPPELNKCLAQQKANGQNGKAPQSKVKRTDIKQQPDRRKSCNWFIKLVLLVSKHWFSLFVWCPFSFKPPAAREQKDTLQLKGNAAEPKQGAAGPLLQPAATCRTSLDSVHRGPTAFCAT